MKRKKEGEDENGGDVDVKRRKVPPTATETLEALLVEMS
jgi:hypothetical protein